HSIGLAVELIRLFRGNPVGNLLGQLEVLRALHNAGCLHFPADTFRGNNDLERSPLRFFGCATHIEGDSSEALTLRGLHAGSASRMRVNSNIFVEGIHELPAL